MFEDQFTLNYNAEDQRPRTICPACLHAHAYKRKGYHYTTDEAVEEIACPICRKTFTIFPKKRNKKPQPSLC